MLTENIPSTCDASSPQQLGPSGFVRLPTIFQLIPISKSLIWEMIARGDFPPPVKLSARISAWRSQDVLAFIEARSATQGARL